MWKKIIPIIILALLIGWGIYDFAFDQSGEDQEANVEKEEGSICQDSSSSDEGENDTEDGDVGILEGNVAPDFTLETLDGEQITLSDCRGKNVIVNFWATWCPPCQAEAPELDDFYKEHKDEYVVLGIDMTSTEKNQSDIEDFVNENDLSFPVPLDKSGDLMSDYAVVAYPTSYFINKEGVIQAKVQGAMNREMMEKYAKQVKEKSSS